jgi:hypothetical protein
MKYLLVAILFVACNNGSGSDGSDNGIPAPTTKKDSTEAGKAKVDTVDIVGVDTIINGQMHPYNSDPLKK